MPPNEVERKSIGLFTGMAILEERFTSAYFRFNDDTVAELKPACEQRTMPMTSSVNGEIQHAAWRKPMLSGC